MKSIPIEGAIPSGPTKMKGLFVSKLELIGEGEVPLGKHGEWPLKVMIAGRLFDYRSSEFKGDAKKRVLTYHEVKYVGLNIPLKG